MLRFAVTDTGIGIALEDQKKLFQSFTQVDASTTRKYGGTGLGLAICKQLVELMGGEIGLESTPHVGSTFWFTLPITLPTTPAKYTPAIASLTGLKMLIITEKPTIRKALRCLTTLWGIEVTEVERVWMAIASLRNAIAQNRPYDVAVIDMQLSEGTILERTIVAEPVMQQTQWILLSSISQREQAKRLVELGFASYVTKPIKATRLFDCLHNIAARGHRHDFTRMTDAPSSISPNRDLSSLKVLLVEDTPINQKVGLNQLKVLGCIADCAANGQVALEMLATQDYDIILMDCQMPVMDGYTTTKELRRREGDQRHTAVIAMTANALKGEREKCIAAGMDDYISKPISLEDLRAILTRWSFFSQPEVLSNPLNDSPQLNPINEERTKVGSFNDGQLTELEVKSDQSEASSNSEVEVLGSLEPPENPLHLSEKIIDLERLQDITHGDAEFQKELLTAFVADAETYIEKAIAAFNSQDTVAVARLAHQLKGGSSTLAIQSMPDLAKRLEQQAQAQNLQGADKILAQLSTLLEQLKAFLATHDS